MVNYHDPLVLASDLLALTKVSHAFDALFLWEFVISLDYVWSVVQGRRPYRRMIWSYSITRFAALMAVILDLAFINITTQTNCQLWITFLCLFAHFAIAFSSLLFYVRIIYIWNRKKLVVILISIVFWNNVSFLIQGVARIQAQWNSEQNICVVNNMRSIASTVISTLVTHLTLLLAMLFGLLRLRPSGGGALELIRMLWKQGVIPLLFATMVHIKLLVFVFLNLNEAFNFMLFMPSVITMSIAATRMYRSLEDFSSTDISTTSKSNQGIGRAPRNVNLNTTVPISPNRAADEEDRRSQTDRSVSYISMDGLAPLRDKSHGLDLDGDLESGIGK
ncbi:hypothetical protein BJV74DRAFT_858047 [Russula compacta]|nr:hypothetical protein BJV74DRAFT_858047 [Russula compacta]